MLGLVSATPAAAEPGTTSEGSAAAGQVGWGARGSVVHSSANRCPLSRYALSRSSARRSIRSLPRFPCFHRLHHLLTDLCQPAVVSFPLSRTPASQLRAQANLLLWGDSMTLADLLLPGDVVGLYRWGWGCAGAQGCTQRAGDVLFWKEAA